ncbi:DNA-dependent protein kinase catalytic subunit [Gigaspora margarita]|uniref:DNA-dependent protein kinase catalytic subunit n=1 Tax=Gigaspora margarita TaxID=4874 RepID=A0A8H4ACJ7_GIGMA|nr:DNA-dependent protein kinase catalytic subunit [Gigaspora margarita]
MQKIINIYFCTLLIKFKNIEQIALNDIDVQEIDLASKFLFDPKTGIIKFLVDNAQKQRLHLLEFLFLYIQKVRSDIEPTHEAFVRAVSFKPMVAMLDSSVRIIDPKKNAHGRYTSTLWWKFLPRWIAALLNSNDIGFNNYINFLHKLSFFRFLSIFVNIWKTSSSDQKQETESTDQQTKDLSIAVRGVGYFVAPAKKFMEEDRLQQLFQDLFKPSAWVVSRYYY